MKLYIVLACVTFSLAAAMGLLIAIRRVAHKNTPPFHSADGVIGSGGPMRFGLS